MNPEVVDARFASEAYDATMVAALAAIIRDNDNGISVARALHDTSDGGVVCHSFGECLNVLTTEDDMNYNGVSGPFAIGEMDKAYFAAKT
jgi:branched-chain amino acid transport system substrate-binding protein